MCSADVSILLSNRYVDNYVPQQQLNGCSMTDSSSLQRVWLVRLPQDPLPSLFTFLLLVQITKMLPLWEASVTVRVLCEMSKYEQESLVHIH